MKGIVFTEFLDLVEDKFGLEMVDKIIYQSNLDSEGVYTAVGTYSFSEMLQLLSNLSRNTGISPDDLLLVYGEHFFSVIETSYPDLLATYNDPIEMLASIENHIHVEVLKIYPDAELPTFIVENKTENSITMVYKSSRAMHHFGLGLMNKTFEYFNSSATISLDKIKEDGSEVRFTVNQN
ncbi:heme NO-binding domain-containing protein [uncultured Polaribacter sp.]|uniref:heme NO-binding domain-containing protein n=1 Tax=uncultured Polaribacter sp. TaxID=174711 RepID=UPI00260D6132|nr:heme NO-binding domain-containing protein [uncultured Polaribacter sp.]